MSPETTAPVAAPWLDAFEASHPDAPHAAWLNDRRQEALARFRALGFPSRRDEDWRYTDVRPVVRTSFRPVGAITEAVMARARSLLESLPLPEEAARLVFVNGLPAADLSVPHEDDAELVFRSLGACLTLEGLARDGAVLEERLGVLANGEGHAFAALNTALFQDGALVRVPRDTVLKSPLHLVFLTVGLEHPVAYLPRILVVAEAGSSVSLVETWAGDGDTPYLSNTVTEVQVGANARVEILELQEQSRSAFHFRTTCAHVARDGWFGTTNISTGAALARNDTWIYLDAPGAECRLDGLSLVDEHQHVDHLTDVEHASPHGISRQLYKGVLDDHASAAYSGKVHVHRDAQKTNAEQANHNLLLSEDATADSKPQLEIYADDVKCTHGATVGQMDDEAIFYLRSRGVGERAARRMLLRAFAAEVPSRITTPALRAHAEAALARRVPEDG